MSVLSPRFALLLLCTVSAFVVSGRAPGAVRLRTRDIEIELAAERKTSRERGGIVVWTTATRSE